MRIRFFTTFSIVFIGLLSHGQRKVEPVFEVKTSPEIKYGSIIDISNLGREGDRILLETAWKEKLSLVTVDQNTLDVMSQNWLKRNNLKNEDEVLNAKEWNHSGTIFFGDLSLSFFESFNKATSNHTFIAGKITEDGKLDKELKVLSEHNAKNRNKHGIYSKVASVDSTHFLVAYDMRPDSKNDNQSFNFKVYNLEMNNIHNFDITLPVKDRKLSVLKYYLDKDKSIYILCRIEKEKAEKEKGQSDKYYSVLVVSPITGQFSEYRLDLDGKEITSVRLVFNENSDGIIAAGFYGDIKGNRRIATKLNGFFSITMNPATMEVIRQDLAPLEDEFVEKLLGIKDAVISFKNADGAPLEFYVSDIIQKSDGGTAIVGHLALTIITRIKSDITYNYVRDNIFVIHLDAEGKVIALTDVPKKQHTMNDEGVYSSYYSHKMGDRLFLIYNDNRNNINKEIHSIRDVNKMVRPHNSVLVAVEVLPDGTYTKQQIWSNKKNRFAACPLKAVQISDNEFIMPAINNVRNKMKILKFSTSIQ